MTPARTFLGVTRACIGIGAWVAPDLTIRVFGMDPALSNRFVGRLFGARELALALALLVAPPAAVAPVAALGAAVDSVDAAGAGTSRPRRRSSVPQARCCSPPSASSSRARLQRPRSDRGRGRERVPQAN